MKLSLLLLSIVAAVAIALSSATPVQSADARPDSKPVLRHVVAFKFKSSATPEQVKKVEQAFAQLPKKISQIAEFEWGMNNSPEKLNKGCTHGFILTFKSEKDRDDYLVHPDHQEFGKLVGPLLDDVFVIDFWAKR